MGMASDLYNSMQETKKPKEPKKKGFDMGLGAWLDRSRRLEYAGQAYIQEAMKQIKGGIKKEGSLGKAILKTPTNVGGLARATYKGLTGEHKATGDETLEKAGWKNTKALSDVIPGAYSKTGKGLPLKKGGFLDPTGRGTAGMALSIGLDPTTYVGGGAWKTGGKKVAGLKFMGKPFVGSKTLAKVLEKTGKKFKKLPGIKNLTTSSGNKVLDKLRKKTLAEKGAGEVATMDLAKDFQSKILKYSKKTKETPKKIMDDILSLSEKHKTTKDLLSSSAKVKIPREKLLLTVRFKNFLRSTLQKEAKAGRISSELGTGVKKEIDKLLPGLRRTIRKKQIKGIERVDIKSNKLLKEISEQEKLLVKGTTDAPESMVKDILKKLAIKKDRKNLLKRAAMDRKDYNAVQALSDEVASLDNLFVTVKTRYRKTLAKLSEAPLEAKEKLRTMKKIKLRKEKLKLLNEQRKNTFLDYERITDIAEGGITEKSLLDIAKKYKVGKKTAKKIAAMRKTEAMGYIPRVTTEQAKVFLKHAKFGNARVWTPKLANKLKRKTGDFTIDEWNDFVAENGLKSLGGKTIQEFFSKDLPYITATRGMRSVKAITSAEFLNKATRLFGKKGKSVVGEVLPADITRILPKLKGYKFSPEILTHLNKTYESMVKPEYANFFLKRVFDPAQNWWKRNVLAYFPAYHTRNMVSNWWNNYLGGVVNPTRYKDAIKIQIYDQLKTTGKRISKPILSNGTDPDMLLKYGKKFGVKGRGLYNADIPKAMLNELKRGNWNVLDSNFQLVKKGMKVGGFIEDNARWAHYIDKIGKKIKPWDASVSVKKYLFDYSELSSFEKSFMKRVCPFYTFTRKNLPLQLESLFTQPGKIAHIGRVKEKIESTSKPGVIPDYLKKRAPLRVGEGVHIPLEGYLPLADVEKIGEPLRTMQDMTSPLIKTPIEQIFNKELFTGREIERFPGERKKLLGIETPKRLIHVLKNVRALAETERATTPYSKVSKEERALRSLTGLNIQRTDSKEQVMYKILKIKTEILMMKKALRLAIKQNRDEEAKRIRKLIKEKAMGIQLFLRANRLEGAEGAEGAEGGTE